MSGLEVVDLRRTYQVGAQRVDAVRAVSFTAAPATSLAITGPSGSGKSTLLGLIAGLDVPDAGRVVVAGRDLAALSDAERTRWRSRHLGVLFQSYRLLSTLTAAENIRLPLDIAGTTGAGARVDDLLAAVGLAGRADHLPAQLSGGEQQRVALARALANTPDLIVADEPTGNLDSSTGGQIADLLFATVREHGAILVLVTHDQTLARRADRTIALRDGQVVPT
jgi:putative ABC transport system ATP-binding protein